MVSGTASEESRGQAGTRPSVAQLWSWLEDIPDPEIPVVSIVDLGIVRDVAWSAAESTLAVVTVTPTYSGCPATEVIGEDIRQKLRGCGVERVELKVQLSPAWTTDWLTVKGREQLRAYGIAPPLERTAGDVPGASLVTIGLGLRGALPPCPRCGSAQTELISQFGSTPCKSLHRCRTCLEPFDHFKCH